MDSKTSSSTVDGPQEPSNHDELFMKQRACSFLILTRVVETLKDYAIKALVSTVDHLGSVADKTNKFLDQKIGVVSEMELRFFCIEQRMEACQEYINHGGLSQQSLVVKTPKHHKRYIFPADEENMDVYSHTKSNYHSSSSSTEHNLLELKNAVQATIKGAPSSIRGRHSKSQFPQFYSRQGTFTIARTSTNNKPERRSSSPQLFQLTHSGPPLKRPVSSNYTEARARRRYPSEPRRSVSLSMCSERDMAKDSDQQSCVKSKRLFKALLSMRKSRKEGSLYKYLDEI